MFQSMQILFGLRLRVCEYPGMPKRFRESFDKMVDARRLDPTIEVFNAIVSLR
jgi:hypothetical protein